MNAHWYVVTDHKKALILTQTKKQPWFSVVQLIRNKFQDYRELLKTKRTMGHGTRTSGPHTQFHYSIGQDEHHNQNSQSIFLKTLFKFLKNSYEDRSYKKLSIIADPQSLGVIRKLMPNELKSCVVQWSNKNLAHFSNEKLSKFIIENPSPVQI